MLHLDYRDNRPIHQQVRDGLRRLMVSGVLQPGDQLPSVRKLATELAINPDTIQRAMAQLDQDGLTRADRTAGRLVTQDTGILDAVRRAEAQVAVQQFFDAMAELGYSRQEAAELIGEENHERTAD